VPPPVMSTRLLASVESLNMMLSLCVDDAISQLI
jgi:hypothetical protein